MEEHVIPQSSSPGSSPVVLEDCLNELLNFIFSSFIDETLDFDIGLSKQYCSDLLKTDHIQLFTTTTTADSDTTSNGGIPLYPLYKGLGSALHQSFTSGVLTARTSNSMVSIKEDDDGSSREKEEEWNKMVQEKGAELVKMLKAVDFELHVQEPFFTQLKVGRKSIEGRCALGDYNKIRPGALLLVNKSLLLEVQDVKCYASFSEMLNAESLEKVLPGVQTIEEGVEIYRKFYSEEKEKSNGVLAICVSKPASQPHIPLAAIVSGLSYEGIGSLLGLTHTTGTIPDALPPPKATLLSSFMMPHNPNVKGSTLTEGARALAKHANRSSDGWWGSITGNDSNKNRLGLNMINNFISNCCWINIHIVPPYDGVFEIRVSEGYGARWSRDGSKFIGFLEPYMEDGHTNRWKH